MVVSNRNFLFQGSIFRCELFVSGRVHPPKTNGWNLKIPRKSGTINPKSPTFGLHVSFSGVIPYLCHRRWTTAYFHRQLSPRFSSPKRHVMLREALTKMQAVTVPEAGPGEVSANHGWAMKKGPPWLVRLYGGFPKMVGFPNNHGVFLN